MIALLGFLFFVFGVLLALCYVRSIFAYATNFKVVVSLIICMVLVALSAGFIIYADAHGITDHIEHVCGITLSPLTQIFHPELVQVEVDFCVDSITGP